MTMVTTDSSSSNDANTENSHLRRIVLSDRQARKSFFKLIHTIPNLQYLNRWFIMDTHDHAGLAGFGQSGKNHPFWTGLNRPVQNLSIVQNCPKLSKTLKKSSISLDLCTIWLNFLLSL